MITAQRYAKILELLNIKKMITVSELTSILDASESTVRRDITALAQANKIIKVFGGAVSLEYGVVTTEQTVAEKSEINIEGKKKIAAYAATQVTDQDFVYIDAGTSTWHMIPYFSGCKAIFVTNAVAHAKALTAAGHTVFLIGGELKASTEAIVGSQATEALRHYNFTKGFFGTNGICKDIGLTTPDINEAMVKQVAIKQCQKAFVLAAASKFDTVSAVTFADFDQVIIYTEKRPDGYQDSKNVIELESEKQNKNVPPLTKDTVL